MEYPYTDDRLKYRLTTDHSASSYDIPVMVDEAGKAYGTADIPQLYHANGDENAREAAYEAGYRTSPLPKRGGQMALSGFSAELQSAMRLASNDWRQELDGVKTENNVSGWLRMHVTRILRETGYLEKLKK